MFDINDFEYKKIYNDCMDGIKYLNGTILNGFSTKPFKRDFSAQLLRKKILHISNKIRYKNIWNRYINIPDLPSANYKHDNPNYFSDKKIAIYTCIIGDYDILQEPLIKPNNIDYYAITDFEIPSKSLWKRIPIDQFTDISGLSNSLKNRFIKMHPFDIFLDYDFSIYVDGSIKILTDFTEHLNRMSSVGFSCFSHSKRRCAYIEAKVCMAMGKEVKARVERYIGKMQKESFPENYGLLACGILVRDHNSEICRKIMSDWWHEVSTSIGRDQVALPFVLFKNDIYVDDIVTLGGDIHKDLSFKLLYHNN